MSYDLEICLPISGKGKYARRFEDFKKFGLKNIGQNQLLISLLTGTEDIPDWDQGWPEEVTVRKIESPLNHCAAKVYHYYSNYDLELIDEVKWFIRLDDDSLTNVSALLEYLNSLSKDDCYYFSTEMTVGDIRVDFDLIRKLGYSHLIKDYSHEVEAGIISQAAFRRILNDPRVREIITKRATIEQGFTDICIAIVARIAGVFPSFLPLISRDPKIYDFLSGEKCHIHRLAHDIDPVLYDVINCRKHYHFVDKTLIYGKFFEREPDFPEFLCAIKLMQDGRIRSNQPMVHEFFWTYDDVNFILCFYDRSFRLTNTFMNVENLEIIPCKFGRFQVFCKRTNVLLPEQRVFIRGFEWKLE